MTINQERAAEIIGRETVGSCDVLGNPVDVNFIIQELAADNLLVPDLPEASRKGVWYPAVKHDGGGVGDIRAGRGKVVVMGMDYQGKPFRLILPADKARDLGLTFVAAAGYAEEAPDA